MQLDLDTILRIRDRITELGLDEDAVDYVLQDYDHPHYVDPKSTQSMQERMINIIAGTMTHIGGAFGITLMETEYKDLPEDFKVSVIYHASGHFEQDNDTLETMTMLLPAAWKLLQGNYDIKRRQESIIRQALARRARLQ